MKFCPFCGSHAVSWPTEASDYVRGFPLCQHHMNGALKVATVLKYCDAAVEREDAKCRLEKEAFGVLSSWAEKTAPGFTDRPDSFPLLTEVFDRATENINPFAAPDYGDPLSKKIEDTEVNRWFFVRISSLARTANTERCAAKIKDAPDSRCTNYATEEGGLCRRCSEKTPQVIKAARDADKMKQIMEILRNE